jgi:hypothetical protein
MLIAAIQSLMQAIEAKLSHEERVLLLVDPDDLETDEDRAALERLKTRARLVRQFGKDED